MAEDADGFHEAFLIDWCPGCGSGFLHDPPDEIALGRWYAAAYYGRSDRKFLGPVQWLFDLGKEAIARRAHRLAGYRTGLRALDIGCGTGRLLMAFDARGINSTGIERGGGGARAAGAGLTIHEGDLGAREFATGSFDIVTIWHVLEHFQDPAAVIAEVSRLLAPGGLVVLAVPNAESFQSRLFGARWFHLDVPRHLHFLAHRALCRRLCGDGFELVEAGTLQWSQSVFGFLQSALNSMFPGRPNRLYFLLRAASRLSDWIELCAWSALCALLLPLAIIETLLAAPCGRGAISVLVLRSSADAALQRSSP